MGVRRSSVKDTGIPISETFGIVNSIKKTFLCRKQYLSYVGSSTCLEYLERHCFFF